MNNKLYSVVSILLMVLMFSACDEITAAKDRYYRYKVAAILDMSGHYSQFGIEAKRGFDEFFLKYPESKFDVLYYDSKADNDIAINHFNNILTDTSIKAVITLTSWVSNTIAPLAKDKNLLHYAIGSAVFDYPANGNTIRYTGDVADESLYLINYLKNYQKIALMYFNNDYGKGWQNRLKQSLEDKLIISKSYVDTDTDFSNILKEINSTNPEIIVLISTKEAVEICKQAKALGIKAQLLGNRPILTEELLNEPSSEGLIFSYPDLDENNQAYKDYVNKYHTKPSSFVAEAYDIASSLFEFTQRAVFNKTAVYNSYKNYTQKGLFSELNFDENAQANCKYKLMIIRNGDYIELE